MTFAEMDFKIFKDNSIGYSAVFVDNEPIGRGMEVSENATERLIENAIDGLYDSDTPLCTAADGKLYKVIGISGNNVKVWQEAELIGDRGERLKRIRTLHYFTLADVEKLTGIKAQTISRFETNRRDIRTASAETVQKFADVYKMSIEELIK